MPENLFFALAISCYSFGIHLSPSSQIKEESFLFISSSSKQRGPLIKFRHLKRWMHKDVTRIFNLFSFSFATELQHFESERRKMRNETFEALHEFTLRMRKAIMGAMCWRWKKNIQGKRVKIEITRRLDFMNPNRK